jgi:hypothetical protein
MARIDAIREVRITEQTFYHWRKQYGGMGTVQRTSHAHPRALRQVYRRDMHEFPHAFPLRHILQPWTAGSNFARLSESRFPRRYSHGGTNSPFQMPSERLLAAYSALT